MHTYPHAQPLRVRSQPWEARQQYLSGLVSATFVSGANGYEQQASAELSFASVIYHRPRQLRSGRTRIMKARDCKVAEHMTRVTGHQSRIGCSLLACTQGEK